MVEFTLALLTDAQELAQQETTQLLKTHETD